MQSGHRDPNPVAVVSAEEEAIKRNTDCVYFLASPLTCKKGNDCEYRHSEGARMNPRDCWYWLNGSCLNLKCAFRHPPLEGLLGTTGAGAGSLVPSQTAASMQMPLAQPTTGYNANKQSVPCFYFQKGLCLKGDRCPFMHGSQPIVNPAPQTSNVIASVTEFPHTFKKATGVLEKCSSQQKIPQINVMKSVEVPPTANHVVKAEIAPNNEIAAKKTMPSTPLYDELPRSKQSNVTQTVGNAASRPRGHQMQLPEEHLQNGREAGEFLRESSPGFDVLVDDEHENTDYFLHEDEYGRATGNGGRHLNTLNEFDYDHASERECLAKFDREPYSDFRDYEQYGRTLDHYGWEHHKATSERILERPSMMERRRLREESPDQIDRLDLRHRLLKQRKINGPRSATSPDRRSEISLRDNRYGEEQRYHGRPQRDQRYFPPESSISNRLQGRIMLPGRSSPDKVNDLRSDREIDRGKNWGRSSPSRPVSYHQGRHHDRMRRTQENFSTEVRNFKGQPINRDEIGTVNFAGPRRLAELKGVKVSDSSEERSTKNKSGTASKSQPLGEPKTMKSGKVVGQLEGSLSFEGPKPLSEILKRKREGASGNGSISSDGEDSGRRERVHQIGSSRIAAMDTPTIPGFDSKKVAGFNADVVDTVEESDNNDEDGPVTTDHNELVHDDPTSAEKGDALKTDDGLMVDTMGDQELEAYVQRGGESDYETVEGGDFKPEDENQEPEEEYLDDDEDGDDFSRRIGAMFS
ncbi:hypothetical protein MRB53_014649 [Persea americana]|uniref:Uncharacterized protein n=1 Tax=Persea americana TaxID=3435 RepID=A0ACC2KC07_PERAE|nr:hypothetical protein MRB53_014649 [Persea americana]|eukprot:TRINITY_DN2776_c0_g1_i2.p1 TRINITY_DN2776_c0_g1~~TRINITY_DN2776_c0_g1_i2.p1  ORF type:complete len:750 (+),score=167.82 TRINITY_DN2776_c0_g1_i2:272-2521(+)